MQRHLTQFTSGVGLLVLSVELAIWRIVVPALLALLFGTILLGVSFRSDLPPIPKH
jgi:hypothetical protein